MCTSPWAHNRRASHNRGSTVNEWEDASEIHLCLGLFGYRTAAELCWFPHRQSLLEVGKGG